MSFTWNTGRRLQTLNKEGLQESFTYNDSGIRTSKTINGVKTEFILDGSNIIAETKENNTQNYFYDESNNLYAIKYNGSMYYYIRNAQNDIISIVDSTGTKVVEYTYNTWGKVLDVTGRMADTLGQDNPFRYRGYYYDTESGLYYLQSRYYDPVTYRFLNADGLVSTGQGLNGTNMFAYCGNNPVNMSDESGNCPYRFDGFWGHYGLCNQITKPQIGINNNKPASSKPTQVVKNSEPFKEFKNSNGSYSLYDNKRNNSKTNFREQIASVKIKETSIEFKAITGGWEWKNFELSPLDFGKVDLGINVSDGFGVKAMATAYAPSATIKVWDCNITLIGNVGSIGGELYAGRNGFKANWGYGLGFGVSVDFDN